MAAEVPEAHGLPRGTVAWDADSLGGGGPEGTLARHQQTSCLRSPECRFRLIAPQIGSEQVWAVS